MCDEAESSDCNVNNQKEEKRPYPYIKAKGNEGLLFLLTFRVNVRGPFVSVLLRVALRVTDRYFTTVPRVSSQPSRDLLPCKDEQQRDPANPQRSCSPVDQPEARTSRQRGSHSSIIGVSWV